jgi:plasmid stabilization system protein ParE
MRLRIFPAAEQALKDIWHYTHRTWGTKQADRYIRGVHSLMEKAAKDRSLWRKADEEELAGVHFVRYEHHYVFFRELRSGEIGIIGVLHESMDIPIRLKKADDAAGKQIDAENDDAM